MPAIQHLHKTQRIRRKKSARHWKFLPQIPMTILLVVVTMCQCFLNSDAASFKYFDGVPLGGSSVADWPCHHTNSNNVLLVAFSGPLSGGLIGTPCLSPEYAHYIDQLVRVTEASVHSQCKRYCQAIFYLRLFSRLASCWWSSLGISWPFTGPGTGDVISQDKTFLPMRANLHMCLVQQLY